MVSYIHRTSDVLPEYSSPYLDKTGNVKKTKSPTERMSVNGAKKMGRKSSLTFQLPGMFGLSFTQGKPDRLSAILQPAIPRYSLGSRFISTHSMPLTARRGGLIWVPCLKAFS